MRLMIAAFALVAMLFAAGPSPAQAPAPSSEAMAAARELVIAMKATEQFKAIFPVLMQGLKPSIVQNRPAVEKDFDAILPIILDTANAGMNDLVDATAAVYAITFTPAELRDITAFYKTPTGQKIVEKTPALAQQSMAAGQAWGRSMATDLQAKMVNELRKRGHNI